MNERERIEAVYELGGTKATYGHEDIIVIVPPFFLLLDCIGIAVAPSGGAKI
jgi:hypothetical protein